MEADTKQSTPSEGAEKQPDEKARDKSSSDPKEDSKGGAEASSPKSPSQAILNDEIEILFDTRLPDYDAADVKAYGAKLKDGGAGAMPYYAIVCEKNILPRTRIGANYAGIINSSLNKLVASGPVYWPPAKEWRYVLVYENTLGKPLIKESDEQALGWRPDDVQSAIIQPMINILLDLRDSDIAHGSIRVSNMFDGGAAKIEKVALGECLATPFAYTQPFIYLPIEKAIANPLGRGHGHFSDDIYAFGVSLAILLRKKDPLRNKTNDEIVEEKIEKGSYAALTGSERFSGAILEILRGTLYDDSDQRWTIDDVLAWADGQRLSPKQSTKKKKAARPIAFNGKKYSMQNLLAKDLNENQAEAVKLIDSKSLEQWITRSLEDKTVIDKVEAAIESAQDMGRGPGYWDRLLSRICVALEPEFPLFYKDVVAHPEGVGTMLAHAIGEKENIQTFSEIISQQLVHYWLGVSSDVFVDVGTLINKYDNCRAFLRQDTPGYGIERCVYYLNPDLHCMSDRLSKYFVRGPEEFLIALENMSHDKKNRPDLFIDRHIAAFLSVKDNKVIDAYWGELNADEFYKRVLGNLKVVATIQQRARMEALPGLSNWVNDMIEPLYERYHDRDLREKFRSKMAKLKDSGDLGKITAIFDNNETIKKDFTNFKQAMKEFSNIREEQEKLEEKLATPESFGKQTAKEVAAVVSALLGATIMLAFGFLHFIGEGVF